MRGMEIRDRVDLYKSYWSDCKAVEPVRKLIKAGVPVDKLEALEVIRALDTELSDLYMVEIPVITCWVMYQKQERSILLSLISRIFCIVSDITCRILSGGMSGVGLLQREIRI